MKLRYILIFVFFLGAGAAWADSYNVDNAKILADFYDGSKLWLPTAYLTKPSTYQFVTDIAHALAPGGVVLAIGLFISEAARIYLGGGSLEIQDALVFYGKAIIVVAVLGLAVTSGTAFAKFFSTVFFAPIEAITGIVKSASNASVLKQIADALADAGSANQDSKLSWFSKIVDLDISMLMVNFFMMFALVISWIISLYIGIMASMMVALGPICIPFMLFQPVSNVAWNWIKSMIAYPMMGVVGAIVTGMIMNSGMLKFAVDAGALGQNLTSIASSVILIIVMVSVPGVTNALFGGIVGSPMAAARSLGSAMAVGAGAGAAMAGATLTGSAAASGAAGRMGLSMAGTPVVGEDGRMSALRGVSQGAAKYGDYAGSTGRAMLESTFPGVKRFRDRLKAQRAASTEADAGSGGTPRGRVAEQGLRGEAAASSANARNEEVAARAPVESGAAEQSTKVGENGKGTFAPNNGFRESVVASENTFRAEAAAAKGANGKDWLGEISGWDEASRIKGMTNFVKVRYGNDMAEKFAEKMQDPKWKAAGIDLSKADSNSYDGVMSPAMYPLLEDMGIKPAVVNSMTELGKKDRGAGWNFSMNSKDGNRAVMTDYVRSQAGDREAEMFSRALDPKADYLSGRQANLAAAVADAVDRVYLANGQTPLRRPAEAAAAVGPAPERSNYRGADSIPEGLAIPLERYRSLPRNEQVGYMREVAAAANNGQYREFAYEVQVPDKWHPRPREGQSFEQATLGAMRELMRRQGYIGKNKKETT